MELGLIARDDLGEGVQQIETPWAVVIFGFPGKNGLCIINKPEAAGDPPEIRFIDPLGASGKWSFCIGDDPATAVEHVLVQGKKDERYRSDPNSKFGELTIHLLSPRQNPSEPRDDGMYLKLLILHDYAWIKNLDLVNKAFPIPPQIVVVPTPEPTPTPVPVPTPDDPFPPDEPLPPDEEAVRQAWIAQDAKHRSELDQIAGEFAAVNGPEFVPDEKTRNKYRSGENKDLKSIHDDMVQRAGFDPGPCQWKQ